MDKQISSLTSSKLDRREFIKNATIASLAASAGLASFDASTGKLVMAAEPASADKIVASSPYGVCAHIGAGEEQDQFPKNLELMKAAGIRWVRADFSWNNAEYPEGNWHYDNLDKAVEATNKLGMQVLPILNYDVPWATPAFKNMDKWLGYVKKTVERYKDRIQYWEIWNEENLQGFWKDEPNGANYALLLKETYKTIKAIDPNLMVVYGGLAGVPVDFFEASLDAGAGESFDVVNIHPYRGGITTSQRLDQFASDIDAFRQALKKRNLPQRPIWITEMGWATPPVFGEANRRVVSAAMQKLFPKKEPRVAFFYDDRYDPSQSRSRADLCSYLPDGYAKNDKLTLFLTSEELQKFTAADADMLIMPPGESFPADCFDAMTKFVKDGGTLVLLGGVPLYYEAWIDEKTGRYVQSKGNPNNAQDYEALRISWYAWWTRKDVPETTPTVVAPESLEEMPGYYPVYQATRFFDGAKLKEGDKFIPLLNGKTENFTGATACVYDFNSDYKGAVVLSAIQDDDGNATNRSTVPNQAVFLTQAYLLALANGIDRFFWYEFQAPERDQRDPEHHFGIVGQTLAPKPGYHAYKALTTARPAGSKGAKLDFANDVCVVSWTRPDGQKGWALWSLRVPTEISIKLDGKVTKAFDYLGKKLAKPEGSKIAVAPGAIYLIGPNSISIQ